MKRHNTLFTIPIVILISLSLLLLNSCESNNNNNNNSSKDKQAAVKTKKKPTTVHKEIVKKMNSYKKGIDQAKKSMSNINKKSKETENIISNLRGDKKKITNNNNSKKKRKKVIKSIRSMSDTQTAIYKKSRNLDKCIKRVRLKYNNKNLAGSVKYQFEILKSGKVTNPIILESKWNNDKNGKEVEKCMLKTVGSWKFEEVLRSDKKFIMKSSSVF